jgi:hypothetical protein
MITIRGFAIGRVSGAKAVYLGKALRADEVFRGSQAFRGGKAFGAGKAQGAPSMRTLRRMSKRPAVMSQHQNV